MNLSGFLDDENATFQQFDINVTEQPRHPDEQDAIDMLRYVMSFVCLALMGVPGNILSAIIWLRRHVTSKNSSALYLAVIAFNDLAYLIIDSIETAPVMVSLSAWLEFCIIAVYLTTQILEPLLVLSFSVERLVAISCPLQVCYMCLYV